MSAQDEEIVKLVLQYFTPQDSENYVNICFSLVLIYSCSHKSKMLEEEQLLFNVNDNSVKNLVTVLSVGR